MRVPISIKLVVMTVFMLLAVTVPIAVVTSQYFEKTSRQREENINLDLAGARATETEQLLNHVLEKAQTHASVLLKMANDPALVSEDFTVGFMHDKNFLSLEVLKIVDQKAVSLKKALKSDFIRAEYKVDPASVTNAQSWEKFPTDNVVKGSVEIQNASFTNGPPMFTMGFPLVKDEQGRITHVALASIDLGLLQKPLSEVRERQFYMLDRRGLVLAHSDESLALARQDFSTLEAVQVANDSKTPRGQKLLTNPQSRSKNYVAYAKTTLGITVFSEISEDVVLEPARQVKRQTLFIAGMALSLSVFVVFWFSMSLSAPLEILVDLIKLVAKGDFDVQATKRVRSMFKDEVSELAIAFDQMTDGLKERDKVKTLFSKFHGSSVTDDLLHGETKLGGQRKDVVVFFSDIRGFTSFSEKRSPEEVVEMLNEYFGVMVGIINKNGGVVDKFIGDAIMAIWGAPVAGENDALTAVRASLEMRLALAELNERRIARDQPPILIGMGLHAGPAISGTIGSNERMEYTVIGNTVNTASRIEASTKAFGTDLLLSGDVFDRVGESFLTEFAGAAEVKGRSEALNMYKVRGIRQADGSVQDLTTKYSDYESGHVDKVKVHKDEAA